MRRSFSLLFFLCLPLHLLAQDYWTRFPQQHTGANLWSVAYGNGTLVVAGEQGTILSYRYEDDAWLPRASGNSLWLVGAGYGNGRFIVVGDRGTILTSDDDGVTWTPRSSGTTTRLNAVAHGGGRWIAVGEAGAVLVSSDNGNTWLPRPALGSGFLRALAYGQGQFLIGGARGALFSTTDADTFTSVAIATTSDIESVAISSHRFWVVGSNDLRATATRLDAWTISPSGNSLTLRGVAVRNDEEASAIGDRWALSYQVSPSPQTAWRTALRFPGFLATAVVRTPNEVVGVGFAGNIVRSAMNSPIFLTREPGTNAIYGSDVRFGVLSGSTPQSHQWSRGGADVPGATAAEVVLRGITPANAESYGVRLTFASGASATLSGGGGVPVVPGGRPGLRDASFRPAVPGIPSLLVPQPDGKLIVAGNFTVSSNGVVANGLARLNGDGSLDPDFRAGSGISSVGAISAIHLLPDGRMFVRGTFTGIDGRPLARLARLRSDGSVDAAFAPDPTIATSIAGSALARDGRLYVQLSAPAAPSPTIVRVDESGAIDPTFPALPEARLVASDWNSGLLVLHTNLAPTPYLFARYLPDGTRDPAYLARVWNYLPGFAEPFVATQATAEGFFYISASYGKFGAFYSYWKLLPDGRADPNYVSPPQSPYPAMTHFSHALRPEGGFWQIRATASTTSFVTAFGPDGRADPSRYATLPELGHFQIVATGPDGALYAVLEDSPSSGARELVRLRPITGRIGRLTNLSVRAFVSSADEPLIAGFVTRGTGVGRALVRGAGPSLASFGVGDPLRDPRLMVTRNGGVLDTNDDWPELLAPRIAALGAFPFLAGSRDAALETPVLDGNFTGVVTPAAGDSGTALVEFYDSTDEAASSRSFINVSARGRVAADRPLIAGFTISGDVPVTVLVRAAGPALSSFNVPNVLADPRLTLYRGQAALWENDNWTPDHDTAWGFPFAASSKDSAMQVTLAPGSYTAIVSAAANTSGAALLEVYDVP